MSKKFSQTEKKPFDRAYDMIPGGDQTDLREELKAVCEWDSDQLFGMKKNGRRGLTGREIILVRHAFAIRGIDAFTGEPLKELVYGTA